MEDVADEEVAKATRGAFMIVAWAAGCHAGGRLCQRCRLCTKSTVRVGHAPSRLRSGTCLASPSSGVHNESHSYSFAARRSARSGPACQKDLPLPRCEGRGPPRSLRRKPVCSAAAISIVPAARLGSPAVAPLPGLPRACTTIGVNDPSNNWFLIVKLCHTFAALLAVACVLFPARLLPAAETTAALVRSPAG